MDDRYEVILGKRSFEISSTTKHLKDRENYDFALFGALALALTHNIEITTNLPISKPAADSAKKINSLMELWHSRKIYPNKLKLNNIVEATHPKSSQNHFAALECQNEQRLVNSMSPTTLNHFGFQWEMLTL